MPFETITRVVFAGRRGDDRAEVIRHPDGLVAVLADGAGGSSGGAEAADTVLLWVRALCSRDVDIRSGATWSDLLAKVDRQLECSNGETTAVVVAVWEGRLVGASVGDSAAWLIRPDGCDDLTAAQQYKPLLGRGMAKPVAFERNATNGTLLLASDGLVKYAPRQRICQSVMLPDLNAAADALVNIVRLCSGALQDDVSFILCRPATKPVQVSQERKRYVLTDGGDLVE